MFYEVLRCFHAGEVVRPSTAPTCNHRWPPILWSALLTEVQIVIICTTEVNALGAVVFEERFHFAFFFDSLQSL